MVLSRRDNVQYVVWLLFSIVFICAFVRFYSDPADRHRCQSLLNHGWWLDESHRNWQPEDCMLHKYARDDTVSCLSNSHVLFIGDSVIRTQFYSLVKKVNPLINTTRERHSNLQFEEGGITFEFYWDPFLNSTATMQMFTGELIKPQFLLVGSGLWYLRYPESGGLKAWQAHMTDIFDVVSRRSPNALSETFLFAPIESPVYEKLNPIRQASILPEDVVAMNLYLQEQSERYQIPIPFSWVDMTMDAKSETLDGLHFSDVITSAEANILLNYKCNDKLPKNYPNGDTCCKRYPISHWYQTVVVFFFTVWLPIGIYLVSNESLTKSTRRRLQRIYPSLPVLESLLYFGLVVLFMYMTDRTALFGKIQKQFNVLEFTFLILLALGAGLLTLRGPKKEGTDGGFLHRDQTDEWKGWMQLVILIYHYLGASSISGIYNPVRVLVAAYLFQTGYGHFFFFYKKGDFSIGRVLAVLIRLNLLTVTLQYTMNATYLSYYFTPLVSFWFLVIYFSMWIGNKYNKYPWFLLVKLCCAVIITSCIIHVPVVLDTIFAVLKWLFNINWDSREWRFRLELDALIVYVGMVTAWLYIKFMEFKIAEKAIWSSLKRYSIISAAVAMMWYFWFELSRSDKYVYNSYHPYVSWIPILAFAILRNATSRIRNMTSNFFAFFGKCSLETFIGQFHMWLAADTKGLLVVIPTPNGAYGIFWWLNFVVTSVLFVYLSNLLSRVTGDITEWLLGKEKKKAPPVSSSPLSIGPNAIKEVPNRVEGAQTGESVTVVVPDDEEKEGNVRELKSEWTLRLSRMWADQRIKWTLIIFGLGIVNRWC